MMKLHASRVVVLSLVMALLAAMGCGSSSSDSDDTTGGSDGGGTSGDATTGGGDSGDGGGGRTDGGSSAGDGGGAGDSGPPVACVHNADCPSKICGTDGLCSAPTCTDGAQNGNETDIDCGGGSCPACDSLKLCAAPSDCTSGVCSSGPVVVDVDGGADGGASDAGTGASDGGGPLECQIPTNVDGVKNGNETGVDCGAMGNPTCAAGQGCSARTDCTSDVCTPVDGGTGSVCAAAVCNDMQKNGMETDVDCGGPACPACADLKDCAVADDCKDLVCAATAPGDPLTCQKPTYTDHVKNGNETDVDCGGTGSSTTDACPATKSCLVATDCQSDGCDYTKHCAIRRSCVGTSPSGGHYGADTCGAGGAGSTGAQTWESCCATVSITVTEGSPAQQSTVTYDKYRVTAGRMRAFLEAVNYDVRDFVGTARTAGQVPQVPSHSTSNVANQTVLDPAWDAYLPTSLAGNPAETPDCDNGEWNTSTDTCTSTYAPIWTSVQKQLGDTIFKANSQPVVQGCSYDSPGTHTYYLGGTDDDGGKAQYAQSVYDTKPLQCTDYLMAQAFCIWDGGRLETTAEWAAAWGAGTLPWTADTTDKDSRGLAFSGLTPLPGTSSTYTGCRWPWVNDATISTPAYGCPAAMIPDSAHSIELAGYEYSYEYPALINSAVDYSPFIVAPGRALGRGASGAADIIGGLLEMTSDITGTTRTLSPFPTPSVSPPVVAWAGNGSWEVHNYTEKTDYGSYGLTDKYGKQGMRCVHTN